MFRKIAFLEGWSWFKFNNLGLALGKNLKFFTSVAKRLKLKVRRFWGPNSTFVEVIVEKLVGGPFCLPPSWIGLITCLRSYSLAKQSILIPSSLVLTLMRQLDDLALKSRSATAKKGLLSVNASKFNLKLSGNESKLSAVWLGDR